MHAPARHPSSIPAAKNAARVAGNIVRSVGSSISDQDLVDRANDGDRWASEMLYRRYVQYVASIVARVLRSREDVDDIVQDTFAVAFEHLSEIRDGAAVRVWLARIAVRHVTRRIRRRRLRRLFGLEARVESDEIPIEAVASDGVSADETAELILLDGVLKRLSDAERLAWVLRAVEGESLEDVARICGCSLATAKRRIAAAHATVRAHVDMEEMPS